MIGFLGPGDLAPVALVVTVAACAQMLSGFGFALMAVPLMGLAIDLKTAVVVSTICGTASHTYQAIADGRHRDARFVRLLTVASFLRMPLGLVILDRVDSDVTTPVGGRALEGLAGFVSGVLATSTSTNGSPLVLLLRSRGLSPEVFRSTLNTVFSIVSFVSIAVFAIGGKLTGEALVGTLVGVPGVGLGMYMGARLRVLASPDVFGGSWPRS
jgi:uncharacterized membrane protein YfcA